MQQHQQPQQVKQIKIEKWQIYQPRDNNESVMKVFNTEIKNILKLLIISCTFYLVFTLLSPLTIIVIGLFVGAIIKFVKIKTTEIRKQGLANKLSPKLRQLLFQKSIFDIYSDILYFPIITKIIGAFVKPLIIKPHPDELHKNFTQLPFNFQRKIARKGLLSLAPEKVQQIIVDSENKQSVPQVFGVETWQWNNFQKYINQHQKVHQHTLAKKIVERIDEKVSWTGFIAMASLVLYGTYKMKPSRMRKMFVQNGTFIGLLLVSLITIIKIKKRIDMAKKRKQDQLQIEALKQRLDKDQ